MNAPTNRRRHTRLLAAVLFTIAALPALPATATDPCGDPADPSYASHACKVARLRQQPFVVVATVDSGINPYHVDFRLPPGDDRAGVHPSEYIEGFPQTPPLNLTLSVSSPAQGRSVDATAWGTVKAGEPRWIPGTNVIGVLPPGFAGDFFDSIGHGTGVASLAGGQKYGLGSPDVVLVSVVAQDAGWRWAANQPWIDIVTNSWSTFTPVLNEAAEASHEGAARGQVSCAASGNVTVPLLAFESQGPSTTVHVGAVDPGTRRVKDYSGFPVDVLGITDQPAATHDSIEGVETFTGTSAATPHACALFARAVASLRRDLGDPIQGPHGGGLAVGAPGAGALADGVVTRLELEDAIQATATPAPGDPAESAYVRGGYGIVDGPSVALALEVVRGERARPERPDEDRWASGIDTARDAVWDTVPDCPTC